MNTTDSKLLKLIADYDKHCKRIAQATTININETAQAKLDRTRHLEQHYVRWFEYYFPDFASVKCAWFHERMAQDVINNKRLRYLAELFRSAGKSVHIDMGIPLYLYLAKNDLKFMLLVGETDPKAKQLLSAIQAELQFNNRIKNDYGEKFSQGSWAEGDFTTTDGIKFMSLGFGQNPRGAREGANRPDYIVVDDVDSKKHVNNDRLMRESVDYITEDIWGCFDSSATGTERFIYANNNFHKNSITNRLKAFFKETKQKNKAAKDGTTHFEVLTVCAVQDLETFTPEWPEKANAAYWKEKYENMPYRSFMREYMHKHIADGSIFQQQDILYAHPLPLKNYDALCLYGDLSYKDRGDYKAMVLVGKKGKEFHILLTYLRQKSRADAANWLYDVYERFNLKHYNIRYLIEGLFAMDEFINDFDVEGEKRGYYIPVVADKRPKENKFDRIESISGFFERHNVFFNARMNNADMTTLTDQFLAFEKGSNAHDDGPDAVHGAFMELNKDTYSSKTEYAFGARQNHHY